MRDWYVPIEKVLLRFYLDDLGSGRIGRYVIKMHFALIISMGEKHYEQKRFVVCN